MSEDIKVTDGTILEALNNKVDLDGGNYKGSELEAYIHEHCGSGFNLFDTKISDHIFEGNEAKGWALQGTYVYKDAIAGQRFGYPTFVETCINEKKAGIATQVTLGSSTLTMYINNNGHQFYNIADKSKVDSFFATYGIANFYGVDEENEIIFLPRNKYFAIKNPISSVPVVGNGKTLGVTNGVDTGAFVTDHGNWDATYPVKGVENTVPQASKTLGSIFQGNLGVTTDPTASGLIANTTNVIQSDESKYLYYCVGNTTSDTSWVDVVTQVEGGVKDLEDKTLEGIERLKASSNALTSTQITNCITEIPQRIKLELNNGTLTLKAGSKVIVPNGVNVFDEVVIENDMVFNNTALGNREAYIVIRTNPLDIQIPPVSSCSSGTSTPSEGWYYNTAENKIYRNSLFEGACLPIAKVTYANGSGVVSIDETFNDIGCFGSTIFANKDIKGLIPDGRNTDGTLNNRELNSPAVRTVNVGKNQSNYSLVLNNEGLYILGPFNYVASGATPLATGVCYVEATNKLYNNGGQRWWVYIASFSTDASGRITSLKTKLPFRAVDYNDFANTPHIIETYQNGASWYRVWSDGWCEQGGRTAANVTAPQNITFLKTFKDINYNSFAGIGGTSTTAIGNGYTVTTLNKTTASMTIHNYNSGTGANNYYEWIARGYIA